MKRLLGFRFDAKAQSLTLKETEGVMPVSTRDSPPAIPIASLQP